MEKYDFSGWATKNNLLCSDGRTILKDAFKHNDGQTVPLVWNHQHNEPNNVLGHALLENREDGVYAYGSAQHKVFTYVCKALDMDGEVKYKAYPNCVVSNGLARKIENGAEEVAEVELTIAVSADEYGEVMYEAPEKDITDETVKTQWMTGWNRKLVEKGA